jgi:ABC-2 type transport system ATP-binding protein
LIEGKLTDVKNQYRTNTFEVGIKTNDESALIAQLQTHFKVEKTSFKSLDEELQLTVQLGDSTSNDLISILLSKGTLTHFVEKIPSVNDIFIQNVTDKSKSNIQ